MFVVCVLRARIYLIKRENFWSFIERERGYFKCILTIYIYIYDSDVLKYAIYIYIILKRMCLRTRVLHCYSATLWLQLVQELHSSKYGSSICGMSVLFLHSYRTIFLSYSIACI